jgi:hypothetical protein
VGLLILSAVGFLLLAFVVDRVSEIGAIICAFFASTSIVYAAFAGLLYVIDIVREVL